MPSSTLSAHQPSHPHPHRPWPRASTARIAAEPALAGWVRLIRSEYLEIPGLSLTRKQVERLWGLDPVISDALLGALTDIKFLKQTTAGTFVRADLGC